MIRMKNEPNPNSQSVGKLRRIGNLRYSMMLKLFEYGAPDDTENQDSTGDDRPGSFILWSNVETRLITAHLLAETVMDELIDIVFDPNGRVLRKELSLSFSKKLNLLSKSQVTNDFFLFEDHIIGSLRKLNNLRNKIAHELEYRVSSEEMLALFMGHQGETLLGESPSVSRMAYHYIPFVVGSMLPRFE